MILKNYTLSEETEKEIEQVLAEQAVKYESIKDIILESEFDAGPFFEHELNE